MPPSTRRATQVTGDWGCVLTFLFFLIIMGIFPVIMLQSDAYNKAHLQGIAKTLDELELKHKDIVAHLDRLGAEAEAAEAKVDQSTEHDQLMVTPPTVSTSTVISNINAPISLPAEAIPSPITFNTPSSLHSKSVLVVGGTDGSGTRRVVEILTQLGVTMVSEDPETFDIHADAVGGWPTIVTPILQQTKSLYYDPTQLPRVLQSKSEGYLTTLLEIANSDSRKTTSYVLAKGGTLPKPRGISASRIKYGFKAPVAMTLAPYWAHLLPHFRFLHVLRDGRDIAFSANQGPVEKFFTAMYGQQQSEGALDPPEQAIRLWSDWNTQLKLWASERVDHFDTIVSNKDKSFGYFAIHSEDLVDSNQNVRFAAIAQLALWVGSDINEKELCCLAVHNTHFMGSHDRTEKNVAGVDNLSLRYGKWRELVKNNNILRDSLHRIGNVGLQAFGYEPMRPLANQGDPPGAPKHIYINLPLFQIFRCNSLRREYYCGWKSVLTESK